PASGKENSRRPAEAGADGRLRRGHCSAVFVSSRSLRRSVRVFALWAAATRHRAWRCKRKGNCCRVVWSGGDWDHAQPGAAEAAASRNAKANEPARGRTTHRRAVYDRLLCDVAKRTAKTARRQCWPVATVVVQGQPLRQSRIDGIS